MFLFVFVLDFSFTHLSVGAYKILRMINKSGTVFKIFAAPTNLGGCDTYIYISHMLRLIGWTTPSTDSRHPIVTFCDRKISGFALAADVTGVTSHSI